MDVQETLQNLLQVFASSISHAKAEELHDIIQDTKWKIICVCSSHVDYNTLSYNLQPIDTSLGVIRADVTP
jgi:hypothetical protein